MRCGMCKCIGSVLYSAVSAVTGWGDYCFCTVCCFWIIFCCTGSDRLSRLLFLDCILLYWQGQTEAIIISGLYSAVLAGADWADYYFWIVFCCTGRGRLRRLLLLHCLLLLQYLLFLAGWESGLHSRPVSWIVAYSYYSGTGLLCRPLFVRSEV